MKCIRCGKTDVLNRAVVDQLTRHEHGLFCTDCEADVFGELLENPVWHQDHGCAFCDSNGRFALPSLECVIERDDGTPQLLEYGDLEEAVRLCEAHLEELADAEETIRRTIEA